MADAIDEGIDGPEHADGRLLGRPGEPGGDVVAHVEQQVEVLLAALARLDALHDLLAASPSPPGTACTGRTTPGRRTW